MKRGERRWFWPVQGELALGVPERWRWLARLRFALAVFRHPQPQPPDPRRMRQLGSLPPELRGVVWPPGVTPLGLFHSRRGETQVRLTLPVADVQARAQVFREVEAALSKSYGFRLFRRHIGKEPMCRLHARNPFCSSSLRSD
ncbi:hypothetical protein K7W42_15880 [Deinococcus sp. HMF7604]|uniref:hypothetical protein n=1 Tax=Deinococcus betulae TaxID=2873312 RepID=UPI001CCD4368|nr:hypothetical protein [Deinococcus betulae]MBZ9752331.1 hypothetical protein [Deinococcus betulae]